MGLSRLSHAVGALVLAVGLSGCIDATMEIEVLSDTTARGVATISMDRGIYDLSKNSGNFDGDICEDVEVVLTADEAICTLVEEGEFDTLKFGDRRDENAPRLQVTLAGPGLVRVAFPIGTLTKDTGDIGDDPATLEMLNQFLAGRELVLRVSGGEIVESNMTIADDGRSAELVVSLIELVRGDADVPEEAFAVVKK